MILTDFLYEELSPFNNKLILRLFLVLVLGNVSVTSNDH